MLPGPGMCPRSDSDADFMHILSAYLSRARYFARIRRSLVLRTVCGDSDIIEHVYFNCLPPTRLFLQIRFKHVINNERNDRVSNLNLAKSVEIVLRRFSNKFGQKVPLALFIQHKKMSMEKRVLVLSIIALHVPTRTFAHIF